jgi:hypothetical protein
MGSLFLLGIVIFLLYLLHTINKTLLLIARNILFPCFFLLMLLISCNGNKDKVYPGNQPKSYDDVSTVKVENYINRIYIDLLGREPLDNEVTRDLAALRDGKLSYEVRSRLITRLMTDTLFVPGDSSYKRAYYQRIYDLTKSRLLEGAGDEEIAEKIGPLMFGVQSARLLGDSVVVYESLAEISRFTRVLKSRRDYQLGIIGISDMYASMLDNGIYDVINMNSLNFVNASFDDMFFRFPTRDEFNIAYGIIEDSKAGSLFGGFADNKPAYCQVLVRSREFHEGMIKWCYLTLVGREPNTQETYNLMEDFYKTKDMQQVQKVILMTDEYAHF